MNLRARFLLLLAANLTSLCTGLAAEPAVLLGLSQHEAAKFNVEFQQYSRMQPVYAENGIRAALFEHSAFYRGDWSEEKILEMLKQFHVVHLEGTHESVVRQATAAVTNLIALLSGKEPLARANKV